MEILLIHSKSSLTNEVRFALESQLNATLHWVSNGSSGIDFLIEDTEINLVICEDLPDNMKIIKYLLSIGHPIPWVLIGPNAKLDSQAFPELDLIGIVNSLRELDQLVPTILQARVDGRIKTLDENSKYCRINTELLLKVVPLEADIYIRLSQIKYIKMFRKGRTFGQEDLTKYLGKKKVEYFYIKVDEIGGFIESIHNIIPKIAETGASLPGRLLDRVKTVAEIHEVVCEIQEHLGLSPEVQKIAKEAVDLLVNDIGQAPKLKEIFDLIRQEQHSYHSFHSIAVAHVACSLAATLKWPSETTFNKLAIAAFFHDLLLKPQELAEYDNLEEVTAAGRFSPEEIEVFKTHPLKTAEYLRTIKEIPPDVDMIIAQHHERPTGKGFPRGMTSQQISPLAALFIVAHDLVRFTATVEQKDCRFDTFVRRYKYTKNHVLGTFKKVLMAVEFPGDKKQKAS